MKILYSLILSLIFLVLWSCSDAGKDPLSSGEETDCTQELDCNSVCGGVAINDACGVCDGNGSTCNISYSLTIQPIFNTNCTACHITSTSNNLNLSNYANIMSGDSDNGPVIDDTGDHTISLLWQYVNSGYMPLGNSNLTASQINLIATWINEGALEEPLNN